MSGDTEDRSSGGHVVQTRFVRLVCSEWRCWWIGPESEALRAPDPFNEGDTLLACPKCREQTLHTFCYEPKCTTEATCGTPTADGYRWTCGKHRPNDRGNPGPTNI